MATASVALIVPAYNEAAAIGPVLAEVPRELVGRVFVVTGASSDATAQIAAAHGAVTLAQESPGYGAACAAGVRAGLAWGADYLAFLDGDYSDPPDRLPEVLAPLLAGQADLVLGVRSLARSPTALPRHAQVGNRLVVWLLSRLLGRSLRDLPSFKAIGAASLRRLDMQETTYGWTVEMIVKAVRSELRIAEVEVDYRPRLAGQSKVSGTLRGTVGAGWKLSSCALRYARWRPRAQTLQQARAST